MLHANATLAHRIERALDRSARGYIAAKQRLAPESGAAELLVAGGAAVSGGTRSPPRLSRAQALGLDVPVTREDVQAVRAFYEARHMAAIVSVCPFAHPSLVEQLWAAGFVPYEFDNMLALDLKRTGAPRRELRGTVEVRRVTSEAEARSWAVVVSQGFGDTNVDVEEAMAVNAPMRASASASMYLGLCDGEPAGGAALDVQDGLALLFAASTLPAARNRGVHSALMEARLTAAREAGADVAVVLTEPGSDSQRNLERVGFQVAYTSLVLRRPFSPG